MTKKITIPLTVSAGACTAYGEVPGGGGIVYALDYIPGTIDTGATVTVTDETSGLSKTIWTKASAGTSAIRVHPRVLETLNTDGSALTTTCHTFVCGRIKVVVSSGGTSAAGSVVVHVVEM
jgi:hypothetical protein